MIRRQGRSALWMESIAIGARTLYSNEERLNARKKNGERAITLKSGIT